MAWDFVFDCRAISAFLLEKDLSWGITLSDNGYMQCARLRMEMIVPAHVEVSRNREEFNLALNRSTY